MSSKEYYAAYYQANKARLIARARELRHEDTPPGEARREALRANSRARYAARKAEIQAKRREQRGLKRKGVDMTARRYKEGVEAIARIPCEGCQHDAACSGGHTGPMACHAYVVWAQTGKWGDELRNPTRGWYELAEADAA